ncbi:uncharacterized protein [Parasteatoda tepidariorum]|uniref:uncharacterized protein isoform X1 n=1 Tax=Parasteatoda tepidariorum TaxID=114398 RepID=UPI001C71FAC6|nr:uncharacterized protein LOC107446319 [Parasteatoda tepidariorum]
MVLLSFFSLVLRKIYYCYRYSVDTLLYIATVVTTASLMVLNAALSFLILLEEFVVFCLILPWIPTKKLGDIVNFIRKWGFPTRIHFLVYISLGALFVIFYFISLELHYLQINENLRVSFDEFRNSLLTVVKLFIVIHRFFDHLCTESSLRNTCKVLRKRLKDEKGEDFDTMEALEAIDDDLELENLRYELKKTKLELDCLRTSYSKLQQQIEGEA